MNQADLLQYAPLIVCAVILAYVLYRDAKKSADAAPAKPVDVPYKVDPATAAEPAPIEASPPLATISPVHDALDAAQVFGQDRLDVTTQLNYGHVTPEDVIRAFPPKVVAPEAPPAA